jgi:hypothetical protein
MLAGLLLVASASPAGASTVQLGQVAPPGAVGAACGGCSFLQLAVAPGSPAYTVPSPGGVITSWSFRGGAAVASTDRVRLRLFRSGSPSGNWTVVADGTDATPAPDQVLTVGTQIPVAGGEVIGLRLETAGNTPFSHPGAFGDLTGRVIGDPSPPAGDTGSVVPSDGRMNVSAQLESDYDRDGRGDDTQDTDDDGDGLPDADEVALGTGHLNPDTDGDGVGDFPDNCRGTANPDQADADGTQGGDACDRDDDNDGLSDDVEAVLRTSRLDVDTDDDGLTDAAEERAGLNPRRRDTDRDRLADGLERGRTRGRPDPPGVVRGTNRRRFRPDRDPRTRTDPDRRDTDGDRRPDGREDRNRNGRRDRGESDPRRRD